MEHDWKEEITRTNPNDSGLYIVTVKRVKRSHPKTGIVKTETIRFDFVTKSDEEKERYENLI